MDSIEFVKTKLAGRTWTQLRALSEATGVPAHTIRHIALGNTKNPGYKTVEPLRIELEREGTQ